MTDGMETAAGAVSEELATAPELKPIHIVVMVITLLHTVAIGVWFIVFLAGSKGGSRVRPQPSARPRPAAPAVASAEPVESKKTQ